MNEGMYVTVDAGSILFINAYRFKDSNNIDEVLKGLDDYIRTLLDNTACTYYAGFIDGNSPTFRHLLATTKIYKGQRPSTPEWFTKWSGPMKAFLRDEWNFQVVNDIEADDAVCIYQTWCRENNKNSIMCHGDKDLYQIEGNHYDIRKHTRCYVDKITAGRNLYKQVLVGDPSDNIVGLKGCGKVRAGKLLDNEEDIYRMSQISKFAFIGQDAEEYYKNQRENSSYLVTEGYKLFKENYQLICLLTHSDELPVVWNTYEPKVLSNEPEIDLTGLI